MFHYAIERKLNAGYYPTKVYGILFRVDVVNAHISAVLLGAHNHLCNGPRTRPLR
jgi:hypothetical protein